MRALRALSGLLTRIEGWALVLFLSIMIVLSFAQVLLRNLFGSGLIWGDQLVRQMVMWTGFTGAALAAAGNRHISIDALTKFLPARVRHALRVLTNVFASVVCVYLMLAAWGLLLSERESGGEMFLAIPEWVGHVVIPAGYALLAIHFLINAVENGRAVFIKVGGKG
ncbi:MAG: TRAP transporter small permease [Bacteroidota bacterium]